MTSRDKDVREPIELPAVLAGPILRKVSCDEVNLFVVTSCRAALTTLLYCDERLTNVLAGQSVCQTVKIGGRAYCHLVNVRPTAPLPKDCLIYYDVELLENGSKEPLLLSKLLDDWLYPGQRGASFFIPSQVNRLFFGSCRNIHHPCEDTFVAADQLLAQNLNDLTKRPCLLVHGGDQVYVDDVGGPTLKAIHGLIALLEMSDEALPGEGLHSAFELYADEATFYNRQSVLPKVTYKGERLWSRLLPFRRTMNVFSSVKAENHLISLAEVACLYLLNWSPECWQYLVHETNNLPEGLTAAQKLQFERELMAVRGFVDGLPKVRRLLAHIPNYMIFDDHDVTDDWNLTAQWEDNVYSNPLSRRVISNALVGYWLFQGWGNTPERFDRSVVTLVEENFNQADEDKRRALEHWVLDFADWHYSVDLQPQLVVLDTRTHRWRSERSRKNPSGLLDWERLLEFERQLEHKQNALVVSAAPIFGVKFIESIQRIFTFFGHELMVDAENWMAHPGSAKKLLEIFRRVETPSEIIVLSGDVHYSFCFKAKQRFRDESTLIWQLTSSGFKNEFPLPLIRIFDWMERFLYFAASPVNLFTKRRALEIDQVPLKQPKTQILISKSNIGLVTLKEGRLEHFEIVTGGEAGDIKRFV